MHKISLKDWVILLTIIPTTLICLCVAAYFSFSRYNELDDFLTTQAQSIIEPLAIASTEPLLNEQREKLRHLISFSHRSQSSIVKSIALFTQDNQIFVTSSYHGDTNLMRLKPGESIPEKTSKVEYDDYVIFRAPIIDEFNSLNNKITPIGYVAIQIDKSKIQFNQQSEVLIAFSIVLFGVLINFIFASQLIKNITSPILSMVQMVDRIREGKLESRVSGQLIGELNFLKNGVNSMAQSLVDFNDEMQRHIDQATIDLRESLEQFEIQNVELNIAKRKAQDANKVKSEFLANMSHELRTPLNGVIGFTRQVLKTPLTDTQRDYLYTIERSAANLLSIINDILDFSKLDAGKMVLEKIPYSLREATEEALTLLAPSAHQKNIELSFNITSSVPDSLIGDAMRVKQIIINLASNAIKFTEKGSVNIDIKCEQNDQKIATLKVNIVDTGVGIKSQQQEALFEAFGQADKSITRLYGGTGLGLVISQRLVSEMHGKIGFSSEEGKGSTFWFTFQSEVTPIPLISQLQTTSLANRKVLYFEPHMHSRMATTQIMTDWGMEVSHVTSVEQIIAALSQQHNYDHILIGHDISPIALDGLKDSISQCNKNAVTIHLAINSNSPHIYESLIASGATNCISKPITPIKLSKAFTDKENKPVDTKITHTLHNTLPIKVLAVDDNEANLKLIKTLLLEQVAEVITATNGLEAVELCKIEKYALIFMDIQMPVMDGISALTAIRAKTFNDSTPIIAVTAHALHGEKDKLIEQGFNFYMSKPLDESMLSHAIYEYCDMAKFNEHKPNNPEIALPEVSSSLYTTAIIDWSLALKRAGNKEELAKEMLLGLTKSLPEAKVHITEAMTSQDLEQLKALIHKLNGACCYSGVPNLSKVTHQIETYLKQGMGVEELEPEFFEFFEHLDNVIKVAPQVLSSLNVPTAKLNIQL
ncbi:two-component sensor histidine kinase BarA [Pseudocolwellia agarivorans]|uniref:two-component sensor histidine kinase BarA n=1 Tax=Pseudocolwellia agarivorans TaxID=1911682 RepID=UPI000987C28E|nr:two-component sensor histidine kinase BarA [Pseudocolwellia agarivorans]